jgi:hypothetical protein
MRQTSHQQTTTPMDHMPWTCHNNWAFATKALSAFPRGFLPGLGFLNCECGDFSTLMRVIAKSFCPRSQAHKMVLLAHLLILPLSQSIRRYIIMKEHYPFCHLWWFGDRCQDHEVHHVACNLNVQRWQLYCRWAFNIIAPAMFIYPEQTQLTNENCAWILLSFSNCTILVYTYEARVWATRFLWQ